MTMVDEVFWPDAHLAGVTVDYDTVRISLDCDDGVRRTIPAFDACMPWQKLEAFERTVVL
jgi:hypothetical protein